MVTGIRSISMGALLPQGNGCMNMVCYGSDSMGCDAYDKRLTYIMYTYCKCTVHALGREGSKGTLHCIAG